MDTWHGRAFGYPSSGLHYAGAAWSDLPMRRCRAGASGAQVLAVAMVPEGPSRPEAAEPNGMDRKTLRDWAHRHNAPGRAALSIGALLRRAGFSTARRKPS